MHEETVSPSAYRFRPHWEVLPAGTQLWRLHKSRFAAEEFKPFDPKDRSPGRFHGTPEDPYPCLYAATDAETALAETLLRSVDYDPETGMRLILWAQVRGRSLNVVRTRCELKLVSLCSGAALAAVCQDNRLLENEGEEHYGRTRLWAREIRAQAPEAMGMIWGSKRNPSQRPSCSSGTVSRTARAGRSIHSRTAASPTSAHRTASRRPTSCWNPSVRRSGSRCTAEPVALPGRLTSARLSPCDTWCHR
ncbi:RES family NAD+ phosphorylase [Streptomyces sp. FXJ1.4098]|nr:RES family NAD+ phosphorylase [Streptomyces sp. FXJ1.4098]